MSDLSTLIAYLERATGPDRMLDERIVKALQPEAMFQEMAGYEGEPIVLHAEPLVGWKHTLPHFTGSVDAALSLVPEGMGFGLLVNRAGDETRADIWGERTDKPFATRHRVPAIALCLAALRSRQSTPEESAT